MAVVGGLLSSLKSANATSYTYTVIAPPNAIAMYLVTGINDLGQIVGRFGCSTGTCSFLETNGVFSSVAVPGADNTYAQGINNLGQMLLLFTNSANVDGASVLYTNGVLAPISVPGANYTLASGINDLGQIVGSYNVGGVGGIGAVFRSFLYTDGMFTTINVPGAEVTSAQDINNLGQIVGGFSYSSGQGYGFLASNGNFTTISIAGANLVDAIGINDLGEIVGRVDGLNGTKGFVDINGIITTITVPGAETTIAEAVNDNGQIVGIFQDASGVVHGFLATPTGANVPEPSTLALFSVGLFGLGTIRRWFTRHDQKTTADPRFARGADLKPADERPIR